MMRGVYCTVLYSSYDEGAYCTAVMMRGCIGHYDEGVYCSSYDEGVYWVMMRGHIVQQL